MIDSVDIVASNLLEYNLIEVHHAFIGIKRISIIMQNNNQAVVVTMMMCYPTVEKQH